MITIDGIEFPDHGYDERGDVLYLNTAGYDAGGLPPSGWETDEGYGIEYDEDRNVIAMTLVNVKWFVERDGELRITWPDGHVSHTAADALQLDAGEATKAGARPGTSWDVLGRLGPQHRGA